MTSKTKTKNAAIAARTAVLPKIPKELLDQVVADSAPMTAEQINATTMALKKALIERALGSELSHHLGYKPGSERPEGVADQAIETEVRVFLAEGRSAQMSHYIAER